MTAVRWGQSSSGKCRLASCGDDGSVRVWDAEAGACVHVFDEHATVRAAGLLGGRGRGWGSGQSQRAAAGLCAGLRHQHSAAPRLCSAPTLARSRVPSRRFRTSRP